MKHMDMSTPTGCTHSGEDTIFNVCLPCHLIINITIQEQTCKSQS
ncbi:hypothetical protein DNTS_015279, partial [Danionella cerebrum]